MNLDKFIRYNDNRYNCELKGRCSIVPFFESTFEEALKLPNWILNSEIFKISLPNLDDESSLVRIQLTDVRKIRERPGSSEFLLSYHDTKGNKLQIVKKAIGSFYVQCETVDVEMIIPTYVGEYDEPRFQTVKDVFAFLEREYREGNVLALDEAITLQEFIDEYRIMEIPDLLLRFTKTMSEILRIDVCK